MDFLGNKMELQVGVKILLENKKGKFLVVLRSKDKYPEVGAKWDIVGGRIEKGSTLMENLRREVKEETSLEIKGGIKLVSAQDILKENKHIVRLTYVGHANGEVRLSDEHSDFKWLTLDEISKLEPLDKYFAEVLGNIKKDATYTRKS